MGLTSAQRYNRRADQIWANKAEFDRLTENDKAPNYGVYCAHVEAIAEDATHQPTRDQYTETVTVELAHREALEAEAIKRGIDAKLAANGYTPNGEAIAEEAKTTTHHMTTTEAGAVLAAYACHKGELGGILIVDTAKGLRVHYTTNPGNVAGREVFIDTYSVLVPDALRQPATLADAINTALDNGEL